MTVDICNIKFEAVHALLGAVKRPEREHGMWWTVQTAHFSRWTDILSGAAIFIVCIRNPSPLEASGGRFNVIDLSIILIRWSGGLLGRRVIDLNVQD